MRKIVCAVALALVVVLGPGSVGTASAAHPGGCKVVAGRASGGPFAASTCPRNEHKLVIVCWLSGVGEYKQMTGWQPAGREARVGCGHYEAQLRKASPLIR